MRQNDEAKEQSQVGVDDLSFISDSFLRKKVVDAIETISGLYLVELDSNSSIELKKEIRRVIILYSASIIEAVLLYLYHKGKFTIQKTDYIDVRILPNPYQLNSDHKLVIAKQIKKPKEDRELMLDVLFEHFLEKDIISKELSNKIKKTKNIRNTFHLSKSRAGLFLSPKTIQISTEAIYETIMSVKKYLRK